MYINFKTISLICIHTKISKLHKPRVGRGLKIFCFGLNTEFLKNIYRDGSRTPATSETLP